MRKHPNDLISLSDLIKDPFSKSKSHNELLGVSTKYELRGGGTIQNKNRHHSSNARNISRNDPRGKGSLRISAHSYGRLFSKTLSSPADSIKLSAACTQHVTHKDRFL